MHQGVNTLLSLFKTMNVFKILYRGPNALTGREHTISLCLTNSRRMRYLVTLDLSYNAQLRSISGKAFRHASRLEDVDLSWCGLEHLPA